MYQFFLKEDILVYYHYYFIVTWEDIYKYFDFPIPLYNISKFDINAIQYHSNGVKALNDLSEVIGARKHWYSTEDIVTNRNYRIELFCHIIISTDLKSIKSQIRYINYKITQIYLQPSQSIINSFKTKYNNIIPFISIHLRVGDADNMPFSKYLNKREVKNCIKKIKSFPIKNINIAVISDSLKTKLWFKNELNNILVIENMACHSKNKSCIIQSMIDILALKYSKRIILTRGSSFSLLGMYENINCMNNNTISFIGHDYEHKNYY